MNRIRVLVTGKNSYIGNSFLQYCKNNKSNYDIDTIDLRDPSWKSKKISGYDVVFHVAGIAHNSANKKLKDLYYSVNRDLTIETAKKAKLDGVGQFIYMSSMIVYGNPKEGVVEKNTKPNPENFYGDSKLQAEIGLRQLEDDNFKIAILRPPMIYGPGSKGNYPRLAKLAKSLPIFPAFPNKRSMLFVDNLSSLLIEIIDKKLHGTFHPQNKDYVQTYNMVRKISEVNERKIIKTSLFNPIIRLLINFSVFKKVFGNLIYSQNIDSEHKLTHSQVDFSDSIEITELGSTNSN